MTLAAVIREQLSAFNLPAIGQPAQPRAYECPSHQKIVAPKLTDMKTWADRTGHAHSQIWVGVNISLQSVRKLYISQQVFLFEPVSRRHVTFR